MNIARGVAVVMLVLGAAACSESADESNAPPAGSGAADVAATGPETTAAVRPTNTLAEVERPDATTASSVLASGDIDVATTEPSDEMPVQNRSVTRSSSHSISTTACRFGPPNHWTTCAARRIRLVSTIA